MGHTIFTPKISGEKFFASEYMQFVESINNIEKAINITPGTNNAQIPSSNLAKEYLDQKLTQILKFLYQL